jgi:hypothetical protein
MKNNIATLIVIVMLAVFALPAKAQQFNTFGGAVAPQASFQSTSTMVGTGSAYSSNPMLNDDGTATYNGASYSPAEAPSGPKKVGGHAQEGTPIGDAVLPLMLCALAYLIFRARKRAKGERANS